VLFRSYRETEVAERAAAPSRTSARVLAVTAKTRALVLLGAAALSATSVAQELTVAAAADLSSALTELAANYQKQTGTRVRLAFGSSGNLTQQIKNGAPIDLFFSADEDYPKQLMEERLAEQDSFY